MSSKILSPRFISRISSQITRQVKPHRRDPSNLRSHIAGQVKSHRPQSPSSRILTMAGTSGAEFIDRAEERDFEVRGGGRGGRSRGKGRGGGGRGGGGETNRDVVISKALSKLLRHAAEEAGLKLDAEGFARVDQVMSWPRLKSLQVTFQDIQSAVTENSKQRFSMKPNNNATDPTKPIIDPTSTTPSDWLIRANQGHSIAIDSASLLVPITPEAGNIPTTVIHGTYFAFWQAIIESGGLKRMSRNHIHFSTGLLEDKKDNVISGMRNDAELLIYIDIKRSLDDGVKWWLSDNGVVLTEGNELGVLEKKYFEKVQGRRGDVGILWEDGEEVAELPVAFRNRKAPVGKGNSSRVRGNGNSRGNASGRGMGRGKGVVLNGEGPAGDVE